MDWVFPVTVIVGALFGFWGIHGNYVERRREYARVQRLEAEVEELRKAVLVKRD